METVPENISPDRNKLKSLQVMRSLNVERTHIEDTDQNEDSSLRNEKVESKAIHHIKKNSLMSSKMSIKPNQNNLEIIEENSLNKVKVNLLNF